MTFSGLFIDDEDDVYADTLSTPGQLKFECMPLGTVTAVRQAVLERHPFIVAVDFRLDENPGNLGHNDTYKGSALAQHLRDATVEQPGEDFSVVLLSAEAKIKALYDPDKTAHDLFDRIYSKEELHQRRDEIRAELIGLCQAYKTLRALNRNYDVISLTHAAKDEHSEIDFQELRTSLTSAAAPHVVVRTFLRYLIDRPGPLIDRAEVAARLGIDPTENGHIFKALDDAGAGYTGLLSVPWKRWWSHRVDGWAVEVFGRRPTGMPATERSKVLTEKFGQEVAPFKSRWSGSPDELFAFACACCRSPTELRHSVAAFEPSLPRFAARRRICWDCIQMDRLTQSPNLKIDDVDLTLAEDVKKRPRPPAA